MCKEHFAPTIIRIHLFITAWWHGAGNSKRMTDYAMASIRGSLACQKGKWKSEGGFPTHSFNVNAKSKPKAQHSTQRCGKFFANVYKWSCTSSCKQLTCWWTPHSIMQWNVRTYRRREFPSDQWRTQWTYGRKEIKNLLWNLNTFHCFVGKIQPNKMFHKLCNYSVLADPTDVVLS